MNHEPHNFRGTPLLPDERDRLVAIVTTYGLAAVLAASGGLSRNGLANAMSGLPVLPGTAALARQALTVLAAPNT